MKLFLSPLMVFLVCAGLPEGAAAGLACLPQHRERGDEGRELLPTRSLLPCPGTQLDMYMLCSWYQISTYR